jgi:rare lipoprotein A
MKGVWKFFLAAEQDDGLASHLMRTFRPTMFFLTSVASFILVSGCAHHKKIAAARLPRTGASETGIASWYGVPYHGRRAANGEIYDMEKLTAAHRTLPFGTWVRVRNLENDKLIDVRIQDRGPFVGDRIIDLSRAAARTIDMIRPGIAKVQLTVIASPQYIDIVPPSPTELARTAPVVEAPPAAAPVEPELYGVQIGAFQDRRRADALRETMKERYGAARVVLRQGNPSMWRVIVGEAETSEKAAALADQIRNESGTAFVVRIDTLD